MRFCLPLTLFLITCIYCVAQDASLFHYDVKNGLVDNFVTSIAQDDRGFIWISTTEGLSRFDGKTFKNYLAGQAANSLSSNDVYQIISLPGDRIGILLNGQVQIMETGSGKFNDIKEFRAGSVRMIQKLNTRQYLVSADACFITDENLHILNSLAPTEQKLIRPEAHRLQQNLILIDADTRFFLYDLRTKIFREIHYANKISGGGLAYRCYDSLRRVIYFNNFLTGLYRFSIDGEILKEWPIHEIAFVQQTDNNHFIIGRKKESLGGLQVLDVRTDSLRTLEIEKMKFDATALFLDKDGSQWIGTSQGITRRKQWKSYIKNWNTFAGQKEIDHFPGQIFKGSDNNIYFTFNTKPHLYKFNREKDDWDLIIKDLGGNVWATGMLGDEVMFTNGPTKCISFVPASGKHYFADFDLQQYFKKADFITFAMQHSNGDKWFSANKGGGIIRISAKDKSVQHFTAFSGHGRSFSYFSNCVEDVKGDLWFSVVRRIELAHWDKNSDQLREIKLDTVHGSKGTRGITVIVPDKRGHLWIGFDGAGVADYDPARNRIIQYTFENGLASGHISSLAFDNSGRLWIGTPKGLSYLNLNENQIKTLTKADGFIDDRFIDISLFYDSAENNMWIGSATAITRFNPDSVGNKQNRHINLVIDEITVNGETNLYDDNPQLSHEQNNLLFRFTAIDFEGRDIQFNYRLSDQDKSWVNNLNGTSASYANLKPGNYTFSVRARYKGDKQWTEVKTPFRFVVQNVWYKTRWFSVAVTCIAAIVIFMMMRVYYLAKIHRQRLVLEKQQAIETERTRIATDMHDDFGATLSIIKFISEKIKLRPSENEALKRDLSKISDFSDQMSEKMNEIVWALNKRYDTLDDLISFSRAYAADYCAHHNLELNFVSKTVSNIKVSAELRRNVFLVLKEGLYNVARHAQAQKVFIEFEHQRNLSITLSDDGKGIDYDKIRPFANGLKNMKMRIENIKGDMEILNSMGTTLKMSIPIKQGE